MISKIMTETVREGLLNCLRENYALKEPGLNIVNVIWRGHFYYQPLKRDY